MCGKRESTIVCGLNKARTIILQLTSLGCCCRGHYGSHFKRNRHTGLDTDGTAGRDVKAKKPSKQHYANRDWFCSYVIATLIGR